MMMATILAKSMTDEQAVDMLKREIEVYDEAKLLNESQESIDKAFEKIAMTSMLISMKGATKGEDIMETVEKLDKMDANYKVGEKINGDSN